jgi:hypothetical protein
LVGCAIAFDELGAERHQRGLAFTRVCEPSAYLVGAAREFSKALLSLVELGSALRECLCKFRELLLAFRNSCLSPDQLLRLVATSFGELYEPLVFLVERVCQRKKRLIMRRRLALNIIGVELAVLPLLPLLSSLSHANPFFVCYCCCCR